MRFLRRSTKAMIQHRVWTFCRNYSISCCCNKKEKEASRLPMRRIIKYVYLDDWTVQLHLFRSLFSSSVIRVAFIFHRQPLPRVSRLLSFIVIIIKRSPCYSRIRARSIFTRLAAASIYFRDIHILCICMRSDAYANPHVWILIYCLPRISAVETIHVGGNCHVAGDT